MEIFRHYYTESEWRSSIFYNQHLNNFGFCNLDGSKISGINCIFPSTMNGSSWRYKLDNKKQTYLYFNAPRDNYNQMSTPSLIGFRLSNGGTYYCADTASFNNTSGFLDKNSPATVIFLPLKNNGFLLNFRGLKGYMYGEMAANPSTVSDYSDPRDKNFLIETSTPSLNVKIYSRIGSTNAYYINNGVATFIGLPPCRYNLNWTYILYTMAGGDDGTTNSYYNKYIDYGDGKVLELPFRSNFIKGEGITAYNEPTYSNINENICSMIKLPYDSGYIDGVYLLTTAPQQLQDATFFSFDGRNFLNAFDNYVFELPPST